MDKPLRLKRRFPVPQIDQIIKELRRPFTPEAMQFKIQSVRNSALIVGYIDARQTCERLNLVCPAQWMDEYNPIIEPASGKVEGVECFIGISPSSSSGVIVKRSDVGISEGGIGGLKAVYSDAFKRAGVKWGIGVPIYYTPRFYAKKEDLDGSDGKHYMSRKVEAQARERYEKWLKDEGIKRFGQTLDMGDGLESQGDIEVVPEGVHVGGLEDGEMPLPEIQPNEGELDDDIFAKAEEEILKEEAEQSGNATLRQRVEAAFKDYKARSKDPDKAKQKFELWLNSMGFPRELNALSSVQADLVIEFLTSDEN